MSLDAKLNRKDYGIYAGCCKNCNNYYVGQAMTSFSSVGLNIEYYGTDFATLKIMIIWPYLDIMTRQSLVASLT